MRVEKPQAYRRDKRRAISCSDRGRGWGVFRCKALASVARQDKGPSSKRWTMQTGPAFERLRWTVRPDLRVPTRPTSATRSYTGSLEVSLGQGGLGQLHPRRQLLDQRPARRGRRVLHHRRFSSSPLLPSALRRVSPRLLHLSSTSETQCYNSKRPSHSATTTTRRSHLLPPRRSPNRPTNARARSAPSTGLSSPLGPLGSSRIDDPRSMAR